MNTPKVFISYCRNSDEKIRRVVGISSALLENGVDVVLDEWDLQKGQDKFAFMERMVLDKELDKILIFCDKSYSEKADSKQGGVGTESQIISKEIYENANQDKCIPIALELDINEQAIVPTFLQNRIYIDFSTSEKIESNFPDLLRIIFNKPLYPKPNLGIPPSFMRHSNLKSPQHVHLFQDLQNSLAYGKADYLIIARKHRLTFLEKLQQHIIHDCNSYLGTPIDVLAENLEKLLYLRDEIISFFEIIFSFSVKEDMMEFVIELLESFLAFNEPVDVDKDRKFFTPLDGSNFIYFNYELFLYLIAILIENKKYSSINSLLSHKYCFKYYTSSEIGPFSIFCRFLFQLDENEENQLNSKRIQEFLLNRQHSNISIEQLMQADLILYIRSQYLDSVYDVWPPLSLVHSKNRTEFDIFLRASYEEGFAVLKTLIGFVDKADFQSQINGALYYYSHEGLSEPCFSLLSEVNYKKLMNYNKIFGEDQSV